jgi:hypothetical protein
MTDKVWQIPVTRGAIRLRKGRFIGARTEHSEGVARVLVSQSRDEGRTWAAPTILTEAAVPDLGDGAFLESKRHGLLYACRKNRPPAEFAIEVFQSRDGGKTWAAHSTVTGHTIEKPGGPSRGLWAPFLFETPNGRLLCIYDDENEPLLKGYPGHQWLLGRFWDPKKRVWDAPVVVSRAEGRTLSRDGMGTIAAVGKRLVCALESVAAQPPHPGLIRYVTSDDDGTTWSERKTLYQPPKHPHMALAPFLVRGSSSGRTLYCIFGTDEAQEAPDRPGTPPHGLHLDIKLSISNDGGATWGAPVTVYAGGHRNYLPGLIALPKNRVLALWIDFAANALKAQQLR